uniref:Transthyretin-like family-containing protein n=1 Tax=Strongyloides venezuelensis TaxID=75913 RepID=A0A0K0FV28_STRVS
MCKKNIIFIFLYTLYLVNIYGEEDKGERVEVRGTVLCNEESDDNVRVQIYREYLPAIKSINSPLNWTITNKEGKFDIFGMTTDSETIYPYVYLIHYCNNYSNKCPSLYTMKIPYRYISKNGTWPNPYNAGVIHLKKYINNCTYDNWVLR